MKNSRWQFATCAKKKKSVKLGKIGVFVKSRSHIGDSKQAAVNSVVFFYRDGKLLQPLHMQRLLHLCPLQTLAEPLFLATVQVYMQMFWCVNAAVKHHSCALTNGIAQSFRIIFPDSEMARTSRQRMDMHRAAVGLSARSHESGLKTHFLQNPSHLEAAHHFL